MSQQWFYTKDGKGKVGPVSPAELQALATSGQLLATDMVWKEGMGTWTAASAIKGLFANLESTLEPSPAPPAVPIQHDEELGPRRKPQYDADEDDDRSLSSDRSDDVDDRPRRQRGQAQSIPATEYGLSSVILGSAVLISEFFPILAAMAGGATGSILLIFLLLGWSFVAITWAITGLVMANRQRTSGKIYCLSGLCIAVMALIINICELVIVGKEFSGGLRGRW